MVKSGLSFGKAQVKFRLKTGDSYGRITMDRDLLGCVKIVLRIGGAAT